MVDIKKDLGVGSLIELVESLNSRLRDTVTLLGQASGGMGQFKGTTLGHAGAVVTPGPVTNSDFLSPAGIVTDLGAYRRAREAQMAGGGPPPPPGGGGPGGGSGGGDDPGGMLPPGHGSLLVSEAMRRSAAKSGISSRLSGAGYGLSDLARVSKMGEAYSQGGSEQGSVSETVRKLMASKSDTDTVLASTLQQLQKTITDNTIELKSLAREYNNATTVEEKKAIEAKMRSGMQGAEEAGQGIQDILKHGGPGEGGGPGGFRGAIQKYGRFGGGLLGMASAAASLYGTTALGLDQAVYGKQLELTQASGAVAAIKFQHQMESRDMTRADNILKYAGDFLMPGRSQFLGSSGLVAAEGAAGDMLRLRTDIAKQERTMGLIGGGLKTLGAVGMGAAGFAMGGPIGGMMGLGAAASLLGGVGDVAGSFIRSPYTAMSGGLESGPLGAFGAFRRENYPSLAKYATAAARMQQQQEFYTNIDQFREAELQQFRPEAIALEEIQAMRDAQQRAVVLVGRYAPTVKGMMGGQYGGGTRSAHLSAALQDSYGNASISLNGFSDAAKDGVTAALSERARLKNRLASVTAAKTNLARDLALGEGPEYLAVQEEMETWRRSAASVIGGGSVRSEQTLRAEQAIREIADKNKDLIGRVKPKMDLLDKIKSQEADINLKMSALAPPVGASDAQAQDWAESVSAQIKRTATITSQYSQESFKAAIMRQESGGNPAARPISKGKAETSAYGLYQITKGTAEGLGFDYNRMLLGKGGVSDQRAIAYQNQAMDALIAQNRKQIPGLRALPGAAGLSDEQLLAGMHYAGSGGFRDYLATGADNTTAGSSINKGIGSFLSTFSSNRYGGPASVGELRASEGASAARLGASQARIGMLAGLEMSGAEFMMHEASLTNVLGSTGTRGAMTGLTAGAGATAEMIRLGRSGLGSFEQHTGALANLNRISGGSDNTSGLRAILTEAVAAGFDKSRSAQAFVASTTSIMSSLSLTNAGLASTTLGSGAALMGYGRPDERTLGMAAQGQMAFGKFTEQKGGLPGVMKMLGFSLAGGGLAQGSGYALGMSVQKMQETAISLDGTGPMSQEAETLARLNGGNRQQAAKMLRGGLKTMGGFMDAAARVIGGKSFSEIVSNIKDLKGPEREEAIKTAAAYAANVGASSILGDAGAGVAALQAAGTDVFNKSSDPALFSQAVAKANNLYADGAKQRVRAFRDKMLSDFGASTQGVSPEDYGTYLKSGGAPVMMKSGRYLTQEELDANKGGTPEAREALEGMNRLDLIRESDIAAAGGEANIQSVRVANVSDLATAIALAGSNVGKIKESVNNAHRSK